MSYYKEPGSSMWRSKDKATEGELRVIDGKLHYCDWSMNFGMIFPDRITLWAAVENWHLPKPDLMAAHSLLGTAKRAKPKGKPRRKGRAP